LHVVACLLQQADQDGTDGIVVEVQVHKRLIRSISSSDNRRVLPCFL
jgi:hypothetical protein